MFATILAFGVGGDIGGAILNAASLVIGSAAIGWQYLKTAAV